MKIKNIFKFLVVLFLTFSFVGSASALKTTLDVGDKGTFEEYRYNISKDVLKFKQNFEVNEYMSKLDIDKLIESVEESKKYLPDGNLINTNLRTSAITALKKAKMYNSDASTFNNVLEKISAYIDEARIEKVTGNIVANPTSGPAPLTVTLRGEVRDPLGSVIPEKNYIWYYYDNGKMKLIGRKRIVKYTFDQEGDLYVYLAVVSSHKNSFGNTDVLTFVGRKAIEIKEKAVNFDLEVNGVKVRNKPVLKFTPAEAKRGLLFDATGSRPSKGTEFNKVEWDFGNGIEKDYRGDPKMEKVVYTKEGTFTVELKLWTNENKIAKKRFDIDIRDAVAQIQATGTSGFIGDTFTFSSRLASNEDEENFSYQWKIKNLDTGKTIYSSASSVINYTFVEKGRFNVALGVVDNYNEEDFDNVVVTIASQEPVADFEYKVESKSQPNKIFLDGTKSYDPDFKDNGRLRYTWYIGGYEAKLINPNKNNSTGYYIFDSKGEQPVSLEITDPDDVSSTKQKKVSVDSTLSVDFAAWPRVVNRGGYVTFKANSPKARFFEWNYKDGSIDKGGDRIVSHKFTKAGEYDVELTVVGDDGEENKITKKVYVAPSNSPYGVIDIKNSQGVVTQEGACFGQRAFLVNKKSAVSFTGEDSINVDGEKSGLDYSWKIDNKYFKNKSQNYKFDELGCFNVKLTVKDKTALKTHTTSAWVKVNNIKPTFTNLSISVRDETQDPVIVDVTANNAKDEDGVIQSYLWYYYTNTDPEPQAFRATSQNTTSFVLPKVTGRYTFVVVMKDNSDAKFSSEETGDEYFIELEGDNINTPIVDLKIDNNSILIGDKVNFQAKVRNILNQDITSASEYYWDFDGDGIYEKKTNTPQVEHTFKKSGTFRSKVKVKYKGISNTKTKTIDVANKLIPDFGFIAIGNKFILVDESQGDAVSKKIKFSDGKEKSITDYVVHEFKDGKKGHVATFKIQEGTNIKTKSKRLVYNSKNGALAKEEGLQIFTYPRLSEDGVVTLKNENQRLVVYLGESKGNFKYYAIDTDLDRDTNLNGTKDDDVDNFTSKSYTEGVPEVIALGNQAREQKIRVFLLDENKQPTEFIQDITVIKDYIEEVSVDTYEFDGLTDAEKVKIEKIKEYVKAFPAKYKGESIKYIQALEAGWFDDREKTEVILNFEKFVYAIPETDVSSFDKDDIINTLESFLVEDNEEKSVKNLAYKVAKNLIPNSLENYPELIQKLDFMLETEDQAAAKEAAKFILVGIKDTKDISNENKSQIKESLKVLLADDELIEVEDGQDTTEPTVQEPEKGDIIDSIKALLGGALTFVTWFIAGLFGVLFIFYIWYLVSNKDKNIGFQDFIIEKTSGNGGASKNAGTEAELDDFFTETVKEEPKKEEKKNLNVSSTTPKEKKVEPKKEEPKKEKAPESLNKQDGEMPSWMKGAVEKVGTTSDVTAEAKKETPKSVKEEAKTETVKTEELPDWLKPKEDKKVETKKETPKTVKQEAKTETVKTEELPDWLKPKEEKKVETKKETPKTVKQEAKTETVKTEELPDWLKPKEEKKVETKKETQKTVKQEAKTETVKTEELPDWLKPKEEKKVEAKKEAPKKAKKVAKEEPKKDSDVENDIPDWLKGAIEDEPKEKTVEEKVSEDKKAIEGDSEIPDWLKGTIDESIVEEAKKELASIDDETSTDEIVKEAKKETPKKKTTTRKKKVETEEKKIKAPKKTKAPSKIKKEEDK